MKKDYSFDELVEIVRVLRSPSGCPWDKEQTHDSLKRHLIEEAYEVIRAIEEGDFQDLKEELGDLLLQVVLHSQMASEKKKFDIKDVLREIILKLIRRHPHVFDKVKVSSSEEVVSNWERIKRSEKNECLLESIPDSLPGLLYAYNLQAKAAEVGFDWDKRKDILKKIDEEINELKASLNNKKRLEEEIGDLIFSLVNLSRRFKIDPESALRKVAYKFKKRLDYIEQRGREKGKNLEQMGLEEMDYLWEESKKLERQRTKVNKIKFKS